MIGGKEYDASLERIQKRIVQANEEGEEFCKFIYQALITLGRTLSQLLDREMVEKFKHYVREKNFNNETIEIGIHIGTEIYDTYNVSLHRECDKYQKELRKQINNYKILEFRLKIIQGIFQFILILGATILPFILNTPDLPKQIPTVISIILAVAAAILTYYKFKDHIHFFQDSAEKMQLEYNLYLSRRGHYSDLRDGTALEQLMDKIDELRHEQHKLSLKLVLTEQDKDQKILELIKPYNPETK